MKKYLLLFFTFILYSNQSFSQINCVGALILTPGTQQCGDSAGQAGDFDGSGGAPTNVCNSNYNDDEYWFSYTAVVEGENVDLTLSGLTNTWAGLFVMDDCPSGTPSCVASATNSSSTANIVLNTGALSLGETYSIVIANYGTPNSTAFCLDAVVNPPAPPLDYCGPDDFVDAGGDAADYPSNANDSWTLCPDIATDKVSVTFSAFAVEDNGAGTCYDELKIYDGDDNTASQIGPAAGYCYDGSGTNGTGYPGGGLGVPIVSSHSTGCLHFEFTSDGSVTRAGWIAEVSCTPYSDPINTVALAPAGTTTMTAANAVVGSNGYTYYEDPATAGNYLFAVNWNSAGNGRNDASDVTVTIDNAAADGNADDGGMNATWTMKRYWNVEMGAGAIVDPVDVKFFYDAAEKTATEMAAATDGRPLETPAWFKSPAGTPWANAPAAGSPVLDAIELTDANAGGAMENGVVYAEFAAVPSFSGGSFAAGVGVAGQSALPVELTVFKGNAMENGNKLQWSTASEDNASHYEVERLMSDINSWENIGEVAAFGNSSSTQNYQFMDERPASENFYRLKIVDMDGKTEYSEVIMLKRIGDADNVTTIYPNPTKGNLVLEHQTTVNSEINITIYDVHGKIVYTMNKYAIEAGTTKIPLNIENLSTGVFMLQIQDNTNSQVMKFIKN